MRFYSASSPVSRLAPARNGSLPVRASQESASLRIDSGSAARSVSSLGEPEAGEFPNLPEARPVLPGDFFPAPGITEPEWSICEEDRGKGFSAGRRREMCFWQWVGSAAVHVCCALLLTWSMCERRIAVEERGFLNVAAPLRDTALAAPLERYGSPLGSKWATTPAGGAFRMLPADLIAPPGEIGFAAGLRPGQGTSGLFSSGGGGGAGNGTGGGLGGAGVGFFGTNAQARVCVYVVDMSGSMHGRRFRRAVTELNRSISALTPQQRFSVIMFSDYAVPMFTRMSGPASLETAEVVALSATPSNKRRIQEWLRTVVADGHTHPTAALKLALELRPDVIFFLTDGEIPDGVPETIATQNIGRIPINTIEFENRDGEATLRRLASENYGMYRYIQ